MLLNHLRELAAKVAQNKRRLANTSRCPRHRLESARLHLDVAQQQIEAAISELEPCEEEEKE